MQCQVCSESYPDTAPGVVVELTDGNICFSCLKRFRANYANLRSRQPTLTCSLGKLLPEIPINPQIPHSTLVIGEKGIYFCRVCLDSLIKGFKSSPSYCDICKAEHDFKKPFYESNYIKICDECFLRFSPIDPGEDNRFCNYCDRLATTGRANVPNDLFLCTICCEIIEQSRDAWTDLVTAALSVEELT